MLSTMTMRKFLFVVAAVVFFVNWQNMRSYSGRMEGSVTDAPRLSSKVPQTSSGSTKRHIQPPVPPSITNFNLGGPQGNETYHSFLQTSGRKGSKKDWKEWLSGVNTSHRPKEDILKLLLMTRNEWPTIREWVYYHGAMLGFHNLHIFDGSTDSRCISFLTEAQKQLGVNVVFTQTGLNGLSALLTDSAKKLSSQADFLAKVGEFQ